MDIVTHGITGALVSRALPGGQSAPMMAAGLIGALAPDLDAIGRLWDPMAAITVHRTATHSFLGGVAVAVVVAGLVWSFRRESFFHLFGFAYLGLLSHIGLDLFTPFGTAILWPLTDRRFALAQHYIIDPIFSTIAIAFLIATFRFKVNRTALAKIGLMAIVLYVLITGAIQRTAFTRWQGFAESRGMRPIRSAVLPLFPGPFRWLGVAETEGAFYQTTFWLYGSDARPPRKFSKTKVDLGYVEQL
ncbi:MAG: metal-dependent hydrolase, partial [Candidatus Binatia bacterium]